MKKLISVIAPMYNEENVVDLYVKETIAVLTKLSDVYDFEIILVNDGSKDSTLEKMIFAQKKATKNISIVNLTRNFGLEGAINAGLKKALGDVVIVMDADLQDPPSLILEMIKKWEDGADIVIASRSSRKSDNFVKRATANIYYKTLNLLSGKLKIEHNASMYKLLNRKSVDFLLSLPEVNPFFRVDVPFIGMKTEKVEYEREKRAAGKTKFNFTSLFRYALDGLTSISIEPLRKISILIPFCFFILIVSIFVMIFCSDFLRIAGLVFFAGSFFSIFVFGVLAVIAEYIGQIMIEVRHRPVSLIYEYKPAEILEERKGEKNV